ncbi:MAG: hypothetical protein K1X57_13910 [Gemmataceae bacterium]|nr:hypothetical protein [Gemmataceae bacterium]
MVLPMVLYGSYILAAIAVVAANLAVLCPPLQDGSKTLNPELNLDRGLARTAGIFLFFLFGVGGALCAGSSAIALQVLLLVVTGFATTRLLESRWMFVPTSVVVSVLAFVFVWYVSIRPQYDLYPFESMADRLPIPARTTATPLSFEQTKAMEELEIQVENRARSFEGRWRTDSLKALHDQAIDKFVTSPGFGAMRNRKPHATTVERFGNYDGSTPPQPGPRVHSTETETADPGTVSAPINPELRDHHIWSIVDFVRPKYFGLLESRDKVAGFRSHRFTQDQGMSGPWKVRTVDLVGLLLHPEPVVYVSENLPQMEKLGTIPTRKLTAFEEVGLTAIRSGKDLYAREFGDTMRMLGAIRAVEQCTTCHACDRGELLGAFSYTLGRAKP